MKVKTENIQNFNFVLKEIDIDEQKFEKVVFLGSINSTNETYIYLV